MGVSAHACCLSLFHNWLIDGSTRAFEKIGEDDESIQSARCLRSLSSGVSGETGSVESNPREDDIFSSSGVCASIVAVESDCLDRYMRNQVSVERMRMGSSD